MFLMVAGLEMKAHQIDQAMTIWKQIGVVDKTPIDLQVGDLFDYKVDPNNPNLHVEVLDVGLYTVMLRLPDGCLEELNHDKVERQARAGRQIWRCMVKHEPQH